jgi:recombination protein RecT
MNSKSPVKSDGGKQVASYREVIERQTDQFAMLMPRETVEKFKRIVFTTINDKPDIGRCNPKSILSVCMHAAQDGLYLDGREAAIVPYKMGGDLIATYMPMTIGIRKKVRASGEIADWNCQVVFDNDQFDIAFGDRQYVHHKPALTGGGKRKIIGAYSIATFKDGTKSIEWMTFDQIEEARKVSKAVQSGKQTPWDSWYSEMARKTVTRRHAKSLPMASDIENIFRNEEKSFEPDNGTPTDLPPSTRQQVTFQPGEDYSVANTLDEFASGSLPADDTSPRLSVTDERGGGAQTVGNPPTETAERSAPADNSPNMENVDQHHRGPAPPRDPSKMPTQEDVNEAVDRGKIAAAAATAWKRGRDAAKAGGPRKAIPGEYREDPKLWNAWLDGYDDVGPSEARK